MSIFFLNVFSVSFEYAPLSNKRTLAKVDFEIGVQRTNFEKLCTRNAVRAGSYVTEKKHCFVPSSIKY